MSSNAVREITQWAGEAQPNHIYWMEGNRALGYIKQGQNEPFYFKKPITLDTRGRKFVPADSGLFRKVVTVDTRIKVLGSKGQTYLVDPVEKTCSCQGYAFRGTCRHIKELE